MKTIIDFNSLIIPCCVFMTAILLLLIQVNEPFYRKLTSLFKFKNNKEKNKIIGINNYSTTKAHNKANLMDYSNGTWGI